MVVIYYAKITNCTIKNIRGPAGSYNGRGITFLSGLANTVDQCDFSNIFRIGVHVRGGYGATLPVATITDCTYTGKGTGDWLDYAVEVGGGPQATISNNTISNNLGVASSDGSNSAGILVTTYFGAGSAAAVACARRVQFRLICATPVRQA